MGQPSLIKDRINGIKEVINQTDDIKQCERLQERIVRLQSGIVIITVGANTEIEMIEKKHRLEDSLEASRAALEQGIVLGGGSSLARCSKIIDEYIKTKSELSKGYLPDFLYGFLIIKEVCLAPFKIIVENAFGKSDVLLNTLLDSDQNLCYDVLTNKFINGYEYGLIDPKKVITYALINAHSVAGTLITSNFAIAEN